MPVEFPRSLPLRWEQLLERGVVALENMAKDPVLEVETHPPVCGHCGAINPSVRVHEGDAEGKLAEFVIMAHCLQCSRAFYAIPLQWASVTTMDEAKALIEERLEIGGYERTDQAKTA
jgi:hypothetical protein